MSPSYLESYEDNIKIDKDECIFCGRCADRCILDNIRLNLAPCRQACPMGVNVQGYVQLIKRGQYAEAREVVRDKLPFPEVMCTVCNHPCEQQCEKGKSDESISIRALKHFIFSEKHEVPMPEVAKSTGKNIAIIGGGPAGLVAAYDLAVSGHNVVVYESKSSVGGMLAYGIPAYRLPKEVLERDIAILPKLGVQFKCNTAIGTTVTLQQLMDDNDAVLLTNGLWKSKSLGVPGEDLEGVYKGLEFLSQCREGTAPKLSGNVFVCGGGNMAVDAAMSAIRQGAKSVTMLALEKEGELPAFPEELRQAQRDGILIMPSNGVKGFEGTNGKLTHINTQICKAVFDENGIFNPCYGGEITSVEADAVIIAIGADRDSEILSNSPFTLDDIYQIDALTLQCKDSKVFVAGDYLKGPGSVIGAMALGREAAISADRFVKNEHLRFERSYPGPFLTEFDIDHTDESTAKRQEAQIFTCRGVGDYEPLEGVLTEKQAQDEASRCLSCGGPCGKNRTCWFCLPCEVECPKKALWVEIPYLLR